MLNNKPRVAATDLGCTSMVSLCDPGGYWKQCNVICANTHTHTHKSMSMYVYYLCTYDSLYCGYTLKGGMQMTLTSEQNSNGEL